VSALLGSALRARKPRFVTTTGVEAHALLTHQFPDVDIYKGTAEQLVAAGLISADRLPGQPGCRKVMQYVSATGEILQGGSARRMLPGVRHVLRENKKHFRISMNVGDEAARRRDLDHDHAFVAAVEAGMVDVVALAQGLRAAREDCALQEILGGFVALDA